MLWQKLSSSLIKVSWIRVSTVQYLHTTSAYILPRQLSAHASKGYLITLWNKVPTIVRFYLIIQPQREERPIERKLLREYWYFIEGGPFCTKQASQHSTVHSVLRSVAVQNVLCWLACFVHNVPPSPKFQILPSQLRQRADRAAGLSIEFWHDHTTVSHAKAAIAY
jgi:hypothetical protein